MLITGLIIFVGYRTENMVRNNTTAWIEFVSSAVLGPRHLYGMSRQGLPFWLCGRDEEKRVRWPRRGWPVERSCNERTASSLDIKERNCFVNHAPVKVRKREVLQTRDSCICVLTCIRLDPPVVFNILPSLQSLLFAISLNSIEIRGRWTQIFDWKFLCLRRLIVTRVIPMKPRSQERWTCHIPTMFFANTDYHSAYHYHSLTIRSSERVREESL